MSLPTDMKRQVLSAAEQCLERLKFYRRLHTKQHEYIKDLESRIDAYRLAVKPVVDEIDRYDPTENDDLILLWGNINITLGDLRRIRALGDRPISRKSI